MIENDDGNIEISYDELADRLKNAFDLGKKNASAAGSTKTEAGTAMDSTLFPNAHRLHGSQPIPAAPGTREKRFPDANRLGSGF